VSETSPLSEQLLGAASFAFMAWLIGRPIVDYVLPLF
jgi:hypothetical protein